MYNNKLNSKFLFKKQLHNISKKDQYLENQFTKLLHNIAEYKKEKITRENKYNKILFKEHL